MKPENHEFQKELDDLKHNINDLKDLFIKKISKTADKVPQAIHMGEDRLIQSVEANPLGSVGLAALVGFVLGALFTCKK
jgi:ElaB/YqjD/DUF883 family membrane-anchored ribosome-binding protein